jgi:hypothetical protein
MKVISDRPSKLISWVADYVLLSHQFWSWSNQNYSKNKGFFLVLWLGPILTLTFDHDPLSFSMMVTNLLIHLYASNNVSEMENKKVEFLVKIQFLRYDINREVEISNVYGYVYV